MQVAITNLTENQARTALPLLQEEQQWRDLMGRSGIYSVTGMCQETIVVPALPSMSPTPLPSPNASPLPSDDEAKEDDGTLMIALIAAGGGVAVTSMAVVVYVKKKKSQHMKTGKGDGSRRSSDGESGSWANDFAKDGSEIELTAAAGLLGNSGVLGRPGSTDSWDVSQMDLEAGEVKKLPNLNEDEPQFDPAEKFAASANLPEMKREKSRDLLLSMLEATQEKKAKLGRMSSDVTNEGSGGSADDNLL